MLREITNQLKPLQELVSGFDFANVVGRYVEGFQAHNDSLMGSALRWLRAEYRTKTEARQDLEVRSIIDDVQFYDYLKLFAAFVRLAGYSGLLINIDEMGVFSHRLNSSQARTANYEVLLRILNDCLQGNVVGTRLSCSVAPTRFSRIAAEAFSVTRHWRPVLPTTRSPGPASRISPGR